MISWYAGSTLFVFYDMATYEIYTTGGLVIAGLTFIGIFIKHQQMEIKRLTERLDEAKARGEKRAAQIAELRQELRAFKANNNHDQ